MLVNCQLVCLWLVRIVHHNVLCLCMLFVSSFVSVGREMSHGGSCQSSYLLKFIYLILYACMELMVFPLMKYVTCRVVHCQGFRGLVCTYHVHFIAHWIFTKNFCTESFFIVMVSNIDAAVWLGQFPLPEFIVNCHEYLILYNPLGIPLTI